MFKPEDVFKTETGEYDSAGPFARRCHYDPSRSELVKPCQEKSDMTKESIGVNQ